MTQDLRERVSRPARTASPIRVAYKSRRLNPQYVRTRVFAQTPRRKRGLDPSDVYPFLRWVADDLERRVAAEARLVAENEQLRAALRDRQPENTTG